MGNLTPQDFYSVFRVDFNAGRLFWSCPPKNHAEKVGREAGYINIGKGKNKTYWQVRAFGKTFKRARIIFFMAHGRWPTPCVDHINGDSLDDKLANLRECTYAQNTVSSRNKFRPNGLPRGVYPTKQGRYMARITVNGKTRSLGVFDTPTAAARIYRNKLEEVYGKFA